MVVLGVPGIKLGKWQAIHSLESASKPTTSWLELILHPLGVGTTLDSLDSPRPRFGGNHHLPPYSILCSLRRRLHPNGTNSWDSQVGVSKLSRNCPGWSPGTLGAHNSRLQSPIAMETSHSTLFRCCSNGPSYGLGLTSHLG
jgi:hypothetical protein